MGNIEIRDQQSVRRRTQIFSDRKSYDAARSQYRKSLTQRYANSGYSPIRFSKLSQMPQNAPLTQRKPNTLPQHHTNKRSPILNQQSLQNSKSPTHRQLFIKPLKLKNMQISEHQHQQQQNLPSQKTGKIVSNSNKRVQQERRSYLAFRQIIQKDKKPSSQFETKEIIKKVRNFNDFLNQIKRKLKEDKQETLLRNKSRLEEFNKNHLSEQRVNSTHNYSKASPLKQLPKPLPPTPNYLQKSRSMRRIQVALKLQNQKIQLQKYRKLVERQLSKTHSIQNISLCTKNSGQKILTIQYESILNQNIFLQDNSNASLNRQPSEKTLINRILENHDIAHNNKMQQNNLQPQTHEPLPTRPLRPQKDQVAILKRLKLQYQKMLQNVLKLGRTIERYEMNGNMAQSQVVDDKILIQQASDFSKKGSQFSQRERDFSQRASNISQHSSQFQKEKTQFRQKQSQSRMTQTQLRETQKQLPQKQSQASQRSTQHKVPEFDKSQSQCTKKAERNKSINKVSQVSGKKFDDRQGQIQHLSDEAKMRESIKQFEKEKSSFEREESRTSKAVSQSSMKEGQIRRQESGEMRQQSQRGSQVSNKSRQLNNQDSQLNNQDSQFSKQGSQVSNKSSHTIMNRLPQSLQPHPTQPSHQPSQEISFAHQSSQEPPFSIFLQQNIQLTTQKPLLHSENSKQKIYRIESLFDRLNDLQQEYQETDREVREAIGQQSEGHSQLEDEEEAN